MNRKDNLMKVEQTMGMDKDNWIPFNKPYIIGKELEYISQAVMDHSHISGNGPFTQRCQVRLEQTLGCLRALLTHSCTASSGSPRK